MTDTILRHAAPDLREERSDAFLLSWYVAMHLAALGGLFLFPVSWPAVALGAGSYAVRMFGISAGYHRYFSHRSFRTSRAFQLLLAVLAMTGTQRGVLWWASQHRLHHRASDTPEDPHSPLHGGLVWAHAGWLFARRNGATRPELVKDFARYPELRWLDRHPFAPPLLLVAGLALAGGLDAVFWGYVLSTVLLLHALSLGNTLAHRWDYVLRGLQALGLVWGLCGVRAPTPPTRLRPRRTPSSRWARPA